MKRLVALMTLSLGAAAQGSCSGSGCLLPSACNYNPSAQASAFEDCIWSCYSGCNADACNYSATIRSQCNDSVLFAWSLGLSVLKPSRLFWLKPQRPITFYPLQQMMNGFSTEGVGVARTVQALRHVSEKVILDHVNAPVKLLANGYYCSADFEVQICSNGSASWSWSWHWV